ncbi:MAG: isochorismate synthase [Flavobacteriaceae bacterium]
MIDLAHIIQEHCSQKWTMLCYVLPGEDRINCWFSFGRPLRNDPTGMAFCIQPYDRDTPIEIWSESNFERHQIDLKELISLKNMPPQSAPKPWWELCSQEEGRSHKSMVKTALNSIDSGALDKVVLARTKSIGLQQVHWLEFLIRLVTADPRSFRYVLNHPDWGVWSGATPETLIQSENDQFNTMALAGTRWQIDQGWPEWTDKEYEEHRWVVQEILQSIESEAHCETGDLTNHELGQMQHLRTDIFGVIKPGSSGLQLAQCLHPTPAVCGFPRESANGFIQNHESFDRELYAGFLGFWNPEGKTTQLFVNLRCLKWSNGHVHLFAGGGITRDSDPEHEWIETQRKMSTMGHVIAPFIE